MFQKWNLLRRMVVANDVPQHDGVFTLRQVHEEVVPTWAVFRAGLRMKLLVHQRGFGFAALAIQREVRDRRALGMTVVANPQAVEICTID